MQTPPPFGYERATSVEHAVALLEQLGPEARLVAGGHSLLPMMKLRLARPEHLIDINDLAERARLRPRRGRRAVHRGDDPPRRAARRRPWPASTIRIFHDAERVIADPVVRNRGTVGGSIGQADPSEDLSAVFAAAAGDDRHPGLRRHADGAGPGVPRRPVRDGGRRRPR